MQRLLLNRGWWERFRSPTVNDLLNAKGVYLIFVLKGGASNRYEAFIRRGRIFLI